MNFSTRLVELRKARAMTQQVLADQVGIHVLQIRRYEAATSQPTLDVIRRLALALSTSADSLIFGENERGPGEKMRYQLETISRLPPREQEMVSELLDAIILRHQFRSGKLPDK